MCFFHMISFLNRTTMTDIQIYGSGPTILLLHSFWGSSQLFNTMVESLADEGYQIICADFPGHGDSPVPVEPYHFESLVRLLEQRLSDMGIEKLFSIIGHSMGGYLAQAFASQFPHKTGSLVLLHSPMQPADAESIRLRTKEASFLRSGKKELWLRSVLSSNFAPGNEIKFAGAYQLLGKISRQVTVEGALAAIEAINARCDYRLFFEKAGLPMLVIVGQHDRVYAAGPMVADATRIPQAQIVVLSESGHLGFIEQEAECLCQIIGFLREKPKRESVSDPTHNRSLETI